MDDHKPEEVQPAPQSSSNVPKTIAEIDEILGKAGVGLLPLTADAKINEWKDSTIKVNPFGSLSSVNWLCINRLLFQANDTETIAPSSSEGDASHMNNNPLSREDQEVGEMAEETEQAEGKPSGLV